MEFGVVEIGTKSKVGYQEIPIYLKVDNKLVDSGKKLPVKTIVHYTLPENYEETEKLEEDITNEVLPFTVKKKSLVSIQSILIRNLRNLKWQKNQYM